jgi:hypothetical protein
MDFRPRRNIFPALPEAPDRLPGLAAAIAPSVRHNPDS